MTTSQRGWVRQREQAHFNFYLVLWQHDIHVCKEDYWKEVQKQCNELFIKYYYKQNGKDCYPKKRVIKDRRKRIFFKIISMPWSCETRSLRPAWIFHDDVTRCAKKTPIHANNINAKAIVLLQNIENYVILIPRSCAMWNYLVECVSSRSLNSWTCFGCSASGKVCSKTPRNGKITEGPHTRTTSPARCLFHPLPHSCILLTPFQTRAKLKQYYYRNKSPPWGPMPFCMGSSKMAYYY